MKSKKATSRRLSITRKSYAERLEGFVFFVDRSSGRYALAAGLQNLGLTVEKHDDHFAENVPDIQWISFCGERNWIIVSSDKAIKRNALERQAIISSKVGAFFFTSASISSEKQIAAFEAALPSISRLVLNQKRSFIARISPDGSVELWLDHKGEDSVARKLEKQKFKRRVREPK